MGPWARAEAVVVVLAVWVGVRLATRRRVAHPWFVAFAVAGAGAVLGDARNGLHGPARYAAQLATLFAALAAV
ncbi:MAG: hypothetical protein JO103_11775, partial [Candidatus Eremiobacteraeota bacterium]|nr:hypothetical protein [Candidatus Eremiobacteraeota bacterium]